jgi:HAD superfamily hydrolase (TIGR01459 family)
VIRLRLRDLAERHEVFLVDQYGVLHDGVRPCEGAVDALTRLSAAGRRIAILSNSGKRSAPNADRLARLGFAPSLYRTFMTSGEVAWRGLKDRSLPPPYAGAERVFLVGRGADAEGALEGLDLRRVERAMDADLVLIAGSEGDTRPMSYYRSLLADAAAASTPCICSNPDTTMVTAAGPAFGAGAIADLYEALGGRVLRIGKPDGTIYRFALAALDAAADERAVGIGDSLHHDVAGANAAGLRSALVRSGVHAPESDETLAASMRAPALRPHYLLERFTW